MLRVHDPGPNGIGFATAWCTVPTKGLGRYLLLDAFDRCLRVAREVAFRAIEVEAIDDLAAAFYAKYGFLPFPTDARHLAIAIETVQKVFEA